MGRAKGDYESVHWMCKKFDGTGSVRLQTTQSNAERLKLKNLPYPPDRGHLVDGVRVVNARRHKQNAGSTTYRVMWPEHANGPESKLVTSSFSLSSAHTNETLYVLAEFLRDQGVEFVGLTNKDGTLLRGAGFRGGKLAYLSIDIPHSPACHVDFFAADTPELSRTPGRIIDNGAFNS